MTAPNINWKKVHDEHGTKYDAVIWDAIGRAFYVNNSTAASRYTGQGGWCRTGPWKNAAELNDKCLGYWRTEIIVWNGWYDHDGGEMPVPKGTPIRVRYRDLKECDCFAGDTSSHFWGAYNKHTDIIAYQLRTVEAEKVAPVTDDPVSQMQARLNELAETIFTAKKEMDRLEESVSLLQRLAVLGIQVTVTVGKVP